MQKKVALVTGASRGIGRAVASSLAARGYDLILLARDRGRLQEIASGLMEKHGNRVLWSSVDVRALEETRAVVEDQVGASGRLDLLVNAAGIFRFGTSTLGKADLEDMLATNVKAVHNLCTVCRDALKAAGRAHIFNISSIAGIEGFAPIGGYAASKFALVGYGQSLGKELIGENVRVTTICPDVVDTDMASGSGLAPDQMIAPLDVCRAIDFILSLSQGALVDQLTIRCKTMVEASNIRI